MSGTTRDQPVSGRIDETLDNPLERRLLAGADDAMVWIVLPGLVALALAA